MEQSASRDNYARARLDFAILERGVRVKKLIANRPERSRRLLLVACMSLLLVAWCAPASAARIKDLCEIQGARGNTLKGIGLVVGLAGTGDQGGAAIRAQERMLRRLSIEVGSTSELRSDNVAVVVVTATIPPFAKGGTRIDVHVSSLYDSKSLEGGTLMDTLLSGIDNEVYAVAQGSISVGGFNSNAGRNNVRLNHVTAGRIPMGAYVEREIPSTITDGERITLLVKRPDFGTANNLQVAINRSVGPNAARALGAGTINIVIPVEERDNLVTFIARIQNIRVESDVRSRVVINERTGTLIVGGDVMIRPCHVAHGGLRIRVAAMPLVSQPLPFSEGFTAETEVMAMQVEEEDASLMPLQGVSAADVAEGLNRLKVSPRDLISIFQALRQAGVMDADLEIM